MKQKRPLIVLFLFIVLLTIKLSSQDKGVVVEEVGENSACERAGLQRGDILLSWERPPNPPANPESAHGVIESVFDWIMLQKEQSPRGMVKLMGERKGKKIVFDVPRGEWDIKVRPQMTKIALEAYQAGKEIEEEKEIDRRISSWQKVVQSARAAKDLDLSCWINLQIGNSWAKALKWSEASQAYQTALKEAEESKNAVAQAEVWDAIGETFQKQNELKKAEEAYTSAMNIREKTWGENLIFAKSLHLLGLLAWHRGDFKAAETLHKRALAIREKLAPESLDVASSLINVGNVAADRYDLTTATSLYKRALAIQDKIAPSSLSMAKTLNNLGVISLRHGDLDAAEHYFQRTLAIEKKMAPESPHIAYTLGNLGSVAFHRGDLRAAEDYHKRALAIQEKISPGSLDVAWNLTCLGNVADGRGDLEKAEAYYKQGLSIREKLAPESLYTSFSLGSLGNLAFERGDYDAADAYYKRTLAIQEKVAPDSLFVAASLGNLGLVAFERKNLDEAETYLKRTLGIQEKLAPDSIEVAETYINLGNVVREQGELKAAEEYLNQAMTIEKKLAPGSLLVAITLHELGTSAEKREDLEAAESYLNEALAIFETLSPGTLNLAKNLNSLGMIYQKKNQLQLAADFFRRSILALEAQIGRLGGTQETKAGFRAKYRKFYQDYLDALIKLKKSDEAFHILERSRAKLLLSMLAERDLFFTADVPEEMERTRKQVGWEYDRVQEQLRGLNRVKEKEKAEKLLIQIRELQDKRNDIEKQIRIASPKFASLQYPQPLDLPGVQGVLDSGTAMLSYSVGEEKSYLFVVTAGGGFWVYPLSIKDEELRNEVEKFRRLIQRGKIGVNIQEGLVAQGKHLYKILIHPAIDVIKKSKRILIVPDGPLHVLPFGALVRNAEPQAGTSKKSGRSWQYLIEWKPLHMAVSATVYSELKKQQKAPKAKKEEKILLAFGDPKYPPLEVDKIEGLEDEVIRSVAKRGYDLKPLSATRQEVSSIARIYGEQAEFYLGDEATEERAKVVSKDIQYIHFACHGLLDEQFPLNSGMALTIPPKPKEGQDNGILQAWEIFERVRISADLVTLSACETGLGKEMGGEGLVGITRAFQYAGARSVMASLWEVADITTAELMKHFYQYLKKGLTKDEALRKAQLYMIHKPIEIKSLDGKTQKIDASHPFFWAAFQLVGDWQ